MKAKVNARREPKKAADGRTKEARLHRARSEATQRAWVTHPRQPGESKGVMMGAASGEKVAMCR